MASFKKMSLEANNAAEEFFKDFSYEASDCKGVDFFITVNEEKLVGVSTKRDEETFEKSSFILQVDKYLVLKEVMIQKNCSNALYINFFGDKAIIWDMESIEKYGKCEIKRCNRYTAISSQMLDKQVLMLPKDKGTVFTKSSTGKWREQ